MKNKMSSSDSVFKKKGFYVALYSCIGVVLVFAAVISFASFNSGNEDDMNVADAQPITSAGSAGTEPSTESAMKSMTQEGSYLLPGDTPGTTVGSTGGLADYAEQAQIEDVTAPKGEQNEKKQEKEQNNEPEKTEPEKKEPAVTKETEEKNSGTGSSANEADKAENQQEEEPAKQDGKTSQEIKDVDVTVNRLAEPVFQVYDGDSVMEWPVLGEVVMDYSEQSNVYDVTLEQYRTNDNICIEAQIGSQVKASAEGVVKYVGATRENGNVLVIDHGNGWETTYSQLQDNILVQEGDVVSKGQVIGGVGRPTIYSVLLGSHLSFKVSCAEEFVNPLSVLEVSN